MPMIEDWEVRNATRDLLLSIGFPARAANCISWSHLIRTLDDFSAISAAELLSIPEFGRKSLLEVEMILETKGIRLADRSGPFTPSVVLLANGG